MSNRDDYINFYETKVSGDIMEYPIVGMFTNINSYPIIFNKITTPEQLKMLFEYYGYEQRNAIITGNTNRFERVKRLLDLVIDRKWLDRTNDLAIIKHDNRLFGRHIYKDAYIHSIIGWVSKLMNTYKNVPPNAYDKVSHFGTLSDNQVFANTIKRELILHDLYKTLNDINRELTLSYNLKFEITKLELTILTPMVEFINQLNSLTLNLTNYWADDMSYEIKIQDSIPKFAKFNKSLTLIAELLYSTKTIRELNINSIGYSFITSRDSQLFSSMISNSTDLIGLERFLKSSEMSINSISFVLIKNTADATITDMYALVRGSKSALVDLNTVIPLNTAYKLSTVINDLISIDTKYKQVFLNDVNGIENFESLAKYVIINSNSSNIDAEVAKRFKDIIFDNKTVYSEMFRRWYFMPSDGPYDPIILPMDYPYVTKPITGVIDHYEYGLQDPYTDRVTREQTSVHPIPNGSEQGINEVQVDINIMSNVIDFCYEVWDANSSLYTRYTPSQAVKHFVNLLYDWLNTYIPDREYKLPEYYPTLYEDNENPNVYREDYWRLYRWIRWYAEGIIQNIPEIELNSLNGNSYIQQLIDTLVRYFNDHHGVYGEPGRKVFDKVKGKRHKWLSKNKNKLI